MLSLSEDLPIAVDLIDRGLVMVDPIGDIQYIRRGGGEQR
jgi:hypothetical protein